MKKKLEQFKELHEFFEDRAEKIAELKNNDTYSDKWATYEDGEWEITFMKDSMCGCCPNEEWNITVSDDELLSDFDDIVAKLKAEKVEKEKKAKEQKAAYDKAEKEKAKKKEYEQYKKLKEKYDD